MGFVGESETLKHDPDNFIMGQKYWSYDLETILEALPSFIDKMVFGLEKTMIGYGNTKTFKIYEEVGNESLADTAARLLITLAEQKIIKFK